MPYRAQPPRAPPKRRGLQECLACHTHVLPTADRRCPACGNSVDEAADDGRRSLTIPHEAELPGYCARCGTATERTVRLTPSRTDQRAGGHSTALRLAIALLWPLVALRMRSKKHESITVNLPTCPACEPVALEHVDFERRQVTLVVHRNLRGAYLST